MPHIINSELNNNTITSVNGNRDSEFGTNDNDQILALSKNINDSQVINVSGLKGVYTQSDKYRPFTIFGKFTFSFFSTNPHNLPIYDIVV